MKITDIDNYVPIKIKIVDPQAYLKVSVLVDSPFFLRDVEDIRKYFKIVRTFKYKDYNSWEKHLLSLADFDETQTDEYQEIQKDKLKELKVEFEERIASTRQTFNYPLRFDELIRQAILFNEVNDDSIRPAYPNVSSSSDKYGWKNKYPEINAIMFESYATEKDVLLAFREWKNLPLDEKARTIYDKELYKDSAPNAERDRNWYWQKYKDKMTYSEILTEWNNKCPKEKLHEEKEECIYCDLTEQNVIEQAVSTYRKRIQLLFTSKS
ncbi:MAG: hypothetical protein ACRDFB_01740 [Rhabdochlamydiaceae bacterium]